MLLLRVRDDLLCLRPDDGSESSYTEVAAARKVSLHAKLPCDGKEGRLVLVPVCCTTASPSVPAQCSRRRHNRRGEQEPRQPREYAVFQNQGTWRLLMIYEVPTASYDSRVAATVRKFFTA